MRMRTRTKFQLMFGGLTAFIIAALTVMWNEYLMQGLVRWALAFLAFIGVYGCSMPVHAEGVIGNGAAALYVEKPSETVTRHGRFTVRTQDGGQVVEGGVFTPPQDLPTQSSAAHVLFIDYTQKEIMYYRKVDTGIYEPVIGYAVMTPEPTFLPRPEVRGLVRDIDLKPSWCPKAQARRIYPNLPKGCLPHGHPDNMMGDAKFLISWQGIKGWDAVHLHGTMGYKAGAFWEQETLGCTRLTNDAILELIQKLGPHALKAGIEVVLLRGHPAAVQKREQQLRLRDTVL